MRFHVWAVLLLFLWALMSDRVPRESTQEKSRLLKEKLEERAKAKEIRNSKSKVSSKSNPAIDEHDETSDDYSDAISNPDREPSLVWDSDEESISPSFIRNQPHLIDRLGSDPTVDEIIRDISILNPPAGHSSSEEEIVSTVKRNRKNTSTDGHFLDEIHEEEGSITPSCPSREPS